MNKMKFHNLNHALHLTLFLSFYMTGYSQVTISSTSLIGTWTYLGSAKPAINDTIILTKELPQVDTCSKWIFKEEDHELLMISLHLIEEGDQRYIVATAPTGIKWAFDDKIKRLTILHNGEQYFNLIAYQKYSIKLVRIE